MAVKIEIGELYERAKNDLFVCIEDNPQIVRALSEDSRTYLLKTALKNGRLKMEYSPEICDAFIKNLTTLTLQEVVEAVKRDKFAQVERGLDYLIIEVNAYADMQEREFLDLAEIESLYCNETITDM
jgi:hypothetical protein